MVRENEFNKLTLEVGIIPSPPMPHTALSKEKAFYIHICLPENNLLINVYIIT